jgi:hypothetical protein
MFNEIRYLYPTAIVNVDFTLQDNGAGPFISIWNVAKLGTQPTATKLASAQPAADLAAALPLLEVAAQTYIDSKAKVRGYDSANSCISYLNSSIVAWAADAKAMNTWRDAVWNYCYTNQAAVLAGTTALPTAAQLIAVLPAAPW